MDVIVETSDGREFTIEVDFFDTVPELKQKIQWYHGIPIPRQILLFNGQIMTNDSNTDDYLLHRGSRLQLQIIDEPPDLPPPPPRDRHGNIIDDNNFIQILEEMDNLGLFPLRPRDILQHHQLQRILQPHPPAFLQDYLQHLIELASDSSSSSSSSSSSRSSSQ